MKNVTRVVLWGILMAWQAAPAFAAEGFYVGGSMGQAEIKNLCEAVTTPVSCEDANTGYKVFGGYTVNKNFGIEAAYVNMDEIFKVTDGVEILTFDLDGFSITGVGMAPVSEKLTLFGKIGLFFWDFNVRPDLGTNDSYNEVMVGLGAQYHFTPQVGARVEWERYKDDDSDTDLLSTGIVLSF